MNRLLILIMTFLCSFNLFADDLGDPISLNIYPESLVIPYGATNASVTFTFYIVSNVANSLALSDFQLTALNPPGTNPISSPTYSNNCNSVLPPQGSTGTCTITVTVSASGNPVGSVSYISPINYQFSLSYTGGSRKQTLTSQTFPISFATGLELASASRTFTFVNNCSQNVWLGISSGAVDSITPDPSVTPVDLKSCVTTDDCYAGSTCVQIQTNPTVLKHCLWNNPVPAGGATGYQLTTSAPGNTTTVDFPAYDNGIDVIWSGGIAARIDCAGAGETCAIADCGGTNADGACAIGTGFSTPNTTAEFTLQGKQALVTNTSGYPDADTYDITIINGVTGGGLSMGPTSATWSASNPYRCGTPGAKTANAPLGGCDWANIAPPVSLPAGYVASDFIWVEAGGAACGGGCTLPEVCGHSISGATVNSTATCGLQLGVLTADAVCAIDNDYGAPFNCASTFIQNTVQYSYSDVYGCTTGDFHNSCYSAGASDACCGCQNWASDPSYPAIIPSITESCGSISNSTWQAIARPNLAWLKQACPTAYVFPYDDASSTFTCQDLDSNNVNVTDYTITFCPTS